MRHDTPERTRARRSAPRRLRPASGERRRSTRSGFTTVELMVAITVLLVAVLGSGMAQVVSHDLSRTARETSTAIDELHNAMEEILSQPKNQVPVAGGLYPTGNAIAAYDDRVLADERIVPTYPGYVVGQPVPDVLEIQLTITWTTFERRQRSLSIGCAMSQ